MLLENRCARAEKLPCRPALYLSRCWRALARRSAAIEARQEKLDLEALTRNNAPFAERLSQAQLAARFDRNRALRHIDEIFERVFPGAASNSGG